MLVNGTRGKSSVTRLVAGALREAGLRTIAKTTGSAASVILEDGSETPVKRPFGARITEQKVLARFAVDRGAQALVVECMALRPDSQEAMGRHLVRPTLAIVTNVRVDHVEEIGPSRSETAAVLKRSVPTDGVLVTGERSLEGAARRVLMADGRSIGPDVMARFPRPEFPENIALALAAAAELGVDRETALRGMVKARPDVGALRVFRATVHPARRAEHDLDAPKGLPGSPPLEVFAYFVNGFAANDLVSTLAVWKEASPLLPPGLPLLVLFNNRADREYRLREFSGLPTAIGGPVSVFTVGENTDKAARAFARTGGKAEAVRGARAAAFQEARELLFVSPAQRKERAAARARDAAETSLAFLASRAKRDFVVFGVGNIKGPGLELVQYFAERGEELGLRPEGAPAAGRANPGEETCFQNP